MTSDRQFFTQRSDGGPMFSSIGHSFRENVMGWQRRFTGTSTTQTNFGIVLDGDCELVLSHSRHHLTRGCYFSVTDDFEIIGGSGMLITVPDYLGLNVIGGPVEPWGRLKYIDGCTDTLLIPPIKLGDPCLNALFFPSNVNQTPHTHPSVRLGTVLSGRGNCRTAEGVFALEVGTSFCIPAGVSHSFHTQDDSLTVLAYHPDSDFGPEDRNHPMVNRTIVNGVSATQIPEILTP